MQRTGKKVVKGEGTFDPGMVKKKNKEATRGERMALQVKG